MNKPTYEQLEIWYEDLLSHKEDAAAANIRLAEHNRELEATKNRLVDKIAELTENNTTLRDAVHVVARDLMRLATN